MQGLSVSTGPPRTWPGLFRPRMKLSEKGSASTALSDLPSDFDDTVVAFQEPGESVVLCFQNLSAVREIDQASVYPESRTRDQMSVTKRFELTEDTIVAALVENDFVAHMPPRRKYRVQLRLRDVVRAAPHVVVPEAT